MASISHSSFWYLLNSSQSLPICITSSSMFLPSQNPCKPSKLKRGHHLSKFTCNSNRNNNPKHRRDFLIGLGGLYGATFLSRNTNLSAIAAPLAPPDPTNCVKPIIPDLNGNCCPPSPVIDYQLPTFKTLRVRKAVHSVTDSDEYLAKYKEATRLMKALPPSDPHNFMQQANVHCSYCDGGYHQNGFPDRELQIHSSWLFFPFHRWFLYFYERILGNLIGDPTFALPFWNWDNPQGMTMPSIYLDQESPLYDPIREATHKPPVIVDLDFDPNHEHSGVDPENQIQDNLAIMHKQVVIQGKLPSLFLGKSYRAGSAPNPGAGSLERVPHNTVHDWTGDGKQPNREDMGVFYAAARDPIFFAHHSNVDRIWNIWKTVPGGMRRDFRDDDWLKSSFLFYDENRRLVRVKIQDCLDNRKMGYDFQDQPLPWLNYNTKPKYRVPRIGATQGLKTLRFPLTLDSIQRTIVSRPKKPSMSVEEKEEVLVIDVEYDMSKGSKFDVFINDQGDDKIGPKDSEFAGSYVNLPHSHVHQNNTNKTDTSFRLAITDLLKDLSAKDKDSIEVTLVPKYGKVPVVIKGIEIRLVSLEDENI